MAQLNQITLTSEQTIELNDDIKQIIMEVDERYQSINRDKQNGSQPIMIVHELLSIGTIHITLSVKADREGVSVQEIRGFTSSEAANRFILNARASWSLYYLPADETVH